ncbi:MAG: SseB family protein [Lachnospiraceae bacterium]|nr:SseB family protein [Lachnospiraceae bacterium]
MGLFNFMKKKENAAPEEPELEKALLPETEQVSIVKEEPPVQEEARQPEELPAEEPETPDTEAEVKAEEPVPNGPRIKILSSDQIEKSEENGKILTYLIERYHEMKSRDSLMTALRGLEGTKLWVPMHVLVSRKDLEAMKAATKENPAKPKDPIRFNPDILKNRDGARLFPAFTTRDEIPEDYRKRFQWVQMDAGVCGVQVIKSEALSALIINPFTKNLLIKKEHLNRFIRLADSKEEAPEMSLDENSRFLN